MLTAHTINRHQWDYSSLGSRVKQLSAEPSKISLCDSVPGLSLFKLICLLWSMNVYLAGAPAFTP